MTRAGWWLLRILAGALQPSERAVVLGDIAESTRGLGAGLRDMLGLIVRRQAGLWREWQPWLALLGVAGLVAVPLSRIVFRMAADIGLQLRTYRTYGVRYDTGVTAGQDMVNLICLAVALIAWSWVSGFVLGSLSGRAAWLTWYVFYLVVMNSSWARFVLSGNILLRDPHPMRILFTLMLPLPFHPVALLVFLFSLHGAWLGVRRRVLAVRYAYLVVAAITILTLLTTWTGGWYQTAREVWSGGVWPGVPWPKRLPPLLLASWPAAWLLAIAYRQHNEEETA